MHIKIKFHQLTETWYNIISGDHHKDKDCHFRVFVLHEEYSYGNPPQRKQMWVLEHCGYILDDVMMYFDTEQQLFEWACEWLQKAIQRELKERAQTKYTG